MKRAAGIVFGLGLAVLCLWVVFRGVEDPARLRELILSASPALLSVLVASVLAHIVLRAWRWRTLLAGTPASFYELNGAVAIGYLASLLPARVGEVVRPTLLARRTAVPFGQALATVGVERAVLDLPVILLSLGLALVAPASWTGLGDHTDPSTLALLRASGTTALAVVGAAIAIAVGLARHLDRADRTLASWQSAAGGSLGARGRHLLARALRSLLPGLAAFRSTRSLARLLGESLLVWAVVAVGLHAGVVACGIPLAPLASLLIVPVTAVGIASGTPGGAGTYQLAMTMVLHNLFGAPIDAAVAAGLVVHVVQIIPLLVAGGFFLVRGGLGAHAQRADGAAA